MRTMMPILLTLILGACIVSPLYRDKLDPNENKVTFIDDHDKEEADAFIAAQEWIAHKYHSAHDVVQVQDMPAGSIVVKTVYPYVNTLGQRAPMKYTLSVSVRDTNVVMVFVTGQLQSAPSYIPKKDMPALIKYYQNIHDELLQYIKFKRYF